MKKKILEVIYIAVTLVVFVICYQNTTNPEKMENKSTESSAMKQGELTGKDKEQNTINEKQAGNTKNNRESEKKDNKDNKEYSTNRVNQEIQNKHAGNIDEIDVESKRNGENDVDDNTMKTDGNNGAGTEKNLWENKGILSVSRPTVQDDDYREYDNTEYAWWITRKENHDPSGSGAAIDISQYGAFYLDTNATKEDKVIYLTFDCGYENGNTPAILEALKEVGANATFFVTKNFVTSNPDLVRQMKAEGHNIGNHTVRHLSSPALSPSEFQKELTEVEEAVKEVTGSLPDAFFRPPSGDYSERILKVLQDMGYTTVFWSIAYFDYDTENQPGEEFVVDHFATYHHSGAIPLIHNTSVSNRMALPQVLNLLKEEGYRFGNLKELIP